MGPPCDFLRAQYNNYLFFFLRKGFLPPWIISFFIFFLLSIIIISSSTSLPATKTAHCRCKGNRIGRVVLCDKNTQGGPFKKKTIILYALISSKTSFNGFILTCNHRVYRVRPKTTVPCSILVLM